MRPPAILHVDIDAFFAAVEVLLNPNLKGKPVIVGGHPNERGVVSTASYEARQFGVHSGMPLRVAGGLCPHGIFIRGRHDTYSRISRQFMECLRRFSPHVEEVSIDEAYMDLGGMGLLHSSVYALAEEVKKKLEHETGLSVSLGLGRSRMGAKLAADAAKPGGAFIIFDEPSFINSLSIHKIPGIGPHTQAILNSMGVTRVHQMKKQFYSIWKRIVAPHLFAVPASGLPKHREPLSQTFSRETTFPTDLRDKDAILAHLSYLTDRLSLFLHREKYYTGRIEVKVRFSDFSTFTRRAALPYPTYSYHIIWRAARSLLESLLKKKQNPLRLVGLKTDDITQSRDLLPFVPLASEKISAGVANIRERYGFSSIFTAREMLLEKIYPVERDAIVLKTASLTK